MNEVAVPFLVAVGVVFVIILGCLGMFKAFYRKVDQGTALIVNDLSSQPKVHFTGAMVLPIIYRAEEMPLRLVPIELSRRGRDGLICKDNLRADIDVVFYVRVNEKSEDVLRVAKAVGVKRASDPAAIREVFQAKFSEALKSVGRQFDLIELFQDRLQFRDRIVEAIGKDLNGYALEDVAIDQLDQTPKAMLDPLNIMDAQGIRKITELTSKENITTNDLERSQELAIQKRNVQAAEASLELDRQKAEATAKQKSDIKTLEARAEATAAVVVAEALLQSEQARITTATKVEVAEKDRVRDVELADAARRKALVVVEEDVNRAQALAKVASAREVQAQQVEAEGELEKNKMSIAEIVRDRVGIDKTVATQEESIKELREVSAADRSRQVRVINAEATAQESKVATIKSAEAEAESADFRARAVTVAADAELVAATKSADAKKVLAAGIQAELAAPGLAEASVRAASAEAIVAVGTAEANVVEKRMTAEAQGKAVMAKVNADATRLEGAADASVIEARYSAEATGLTAKFTALKDLTPDARAHEEFRMELNAAQDQALAQIAASETIARENAVVLGTALKTAKIEIIGGSATNVTEQMAAGLGVGKLLDGVLRSPGVQGALSVLGARGASKPHAVVAAAPATNESAAPKVESA